MKAVIIEDEERSRIVLQNLLTSYCPDVEVAGMADSVEAGVRLIRKHTPDIIFLDVHISGGTGFDVLDRVDELAAAVIFTTAYDHYALKAFKFSAIDYLLKPIDIDELKDAVKRAAYVRKSGTRTHQIRNLIAHYKHPDEEPVLLVTIPESVEYVQMPDIVRCQACDDHTEIYMKDSRMLLIDMPVHEIEFLLQDYGFFRVHPAHIVNMKEVRKSARAESILIMYDGSEVPLSASRRAAYRAKM
jgi:two-component system LytT family response regulator